MSLRAKMIVALLATSLLSLVLVGAVAYQRLMSRFDAFALERAAGNFRGDVASYWLTYGSWQDGEAIEPFPQFSMRRRSMLEHERADAARRSGRPGLPDTGDAAEARALPRLSARAGGAAAEAMRGPPPGPPPGGQPPPRPPGEFAPFIFVLFDPDGRVLNPGARPGAGTQATEAERARAVPIEVNGTVVAYASPIGAVNLSETDRNYLGATRDALLSGLAAAAVLAIGLGLLVGNRLSRSLRALTRAIQKMEGGALRQRVEVATRDEVGVLAEAFNHMSDELARSHDEIRAQADQLREMAERDGLTKLYNRRHFETLTQPLYEQAARYVRPLAVMIGDIDFFKRINDGFSHATGDAVLRQIGMLLAAHTRTSDVVARYGGEEFVIAFPETELDEAYAFCERLRQTIEAHPWRDIHPDLKVTMSMGLNADLGQGNVERMLAAADALLYQAKHAGRNRVVHRPSEAAA
ncbi:MAG: GGDEF domain-containing protein [Alphaproteobacteria bacterium]|nr:GGDEF domain-containing protein [Alphaproteobacteria bacterium]